MGIKDFFDKVGDVGRDAANDVAKNIKNAGDFVGDKTADLANTIENSKREKDRLENNPVPLADIFSYYYGRVKLIRIDRMNSRRNGPAFGDAVGFDTNPTNELTVLNLYHDQIESTGFKLIPNWDDDYYFKHPYLTDTYISLNYYFEYIKKSRVSELERIGYDLGAKHIKIVFKEEKSNKTDGENAVAVWNNSQTTNNHEILEIAVDTDLDGNNVPTEPGLLYFKGDSDIELLIHMRMDPNNNLKNKTYHFTYDAANCMSKLDAIRIDSTIEEISGISTKDLTNLSFKEQVASQHKIVLEYSLVF